MKNSIFLLITAVFADIILISSCATYKGDIPLESMIPEESYISPINQDGVLDEFILPVEIPDTKGLKLAGYNISISSETGEVIYSIKEGKVIPQGKTKIAGKKTPLVLPQEIVWAGVDENDSWVDDGVYYMKISAWDYEGNKGELDPIAIIVDNTPPSAVVSLPYMIFSPNSDGNQEVLDVYQTSSSEDEWKGEFLDKDDKVVMLYQWPGLAPEFSWNGNDNSGSTTEDGAFTYRLSSTDRAGNTFLSVLPGIIIERRSYDISVISQIPTFSPNRDGILDKVSFRLEADKAEQLTQSSFLIINEAGDIIRNLTPSSKSFPLNVEFDGKDKNSKFLPEGNYYGVFSAMYLNGNNPVVTSAAVMLDVTPPQAVLSKNFRIFSPDGDGKKDEISINQTTSIESLWNGSIRNSAGTTVKSYQWKERAIAFDWDGKNDAGQIVPDGEYLYSVESTDLAGTSGSYQTAKFVVDTKPTPVTVHNTTAAFSPNNDGINDFMEFSLNPTVKEGIVNWNYIISDSIGNDVYNFGEDSDNVIPSTLSWAGMNKSGLIVEGTFFGTLFVEYEKGNQVTASTDNDFILDLTPPAINHSITSIPFSPDGDGVNDLLKINVSVSDDQGVKNWSASILDPTGQVFLTIPSSRFSNGLFQWNGLSPRNELVQSASDYTLMIKAEDSLGNTSSANDVIPVDILVLKDGDKLKISLSSIYFKPFTADYLDVSPELQAKNVATLDKLAEILKKYSAYKINLEGNAVRIYWDKPIRWLTEENDILLPLSSLRAESIRDALVLRGIDIRRMTTTGNGGYNPLVPHSDLINRWKNRRVEFILIK
ncbi:MAG: gliding motility-associated C-terminal domain-containing protein [Spirochaetaceae bacterium]|nr:gliding motility-associated C-terminal domain-containing protein [Spirochaetaceae bacterium]